MKKATFCAACLAALFGLAVAGCSSMGENTKRGAVGGALGGSILGGVIGHQSGRGIEGAAIGAAVGAVGGGLIGKSIDDKQEPAAEVATPTVAAETATATGEKLGISDIITLSKTGMSDDQIIAKIDASGSVYSLSVEEIDLLKNEGVSTAVVNRMLSKK